MSRWLARTLALAVGAALAAGLYAALRTRAEAGDATSVRFHRVEPPPPDAAPTASPLDPSSDPEDPAQWRYAMTPETAARVFGFLGDPRMAYDPWVYYRDAGNQDKVVMRPDHPQGHWRWKTNSQGCREDHELDQPPRELRVLVAGDSHTCGVCNDEESFANLLEASLARERPGRTVEVLNAGMGGYTFPSYVGTLLRFRSTFAPQFFVVGVFGGNDFAELLVLDRVLEHREGAELPPEEKSRQTRALALSPDALGQGLNALQTFRSWPEEAEPTVKRAVEMCVELQGIAQRARAKLIIVFLPSPFDLAWPHDLPRRASEARAALELSADDLQRNRKMGEAFLQGLKDAGLVVLDMGPVFAREPDPPYWALDFHMNLRGHALVAEALKPLIR